MTTENLNQKKSFFIKYKKEIKAYSLIALPLIWWGIFFVFAFFRSFYFSLTDLRFSIDQISKFSFDNYARILNPNHEFFDVTFWKSLKTTMIWTVVMMLGNNVMGLALAFLLTRLKKGAKFFLGLLFWPTLVSAVVGADLMKMIFNSSESGLMNKLLSLFNISAISWFDDTQFALIGLMITPFLLGFTVKLLIYYASMLSIPKSYYEAAELETKNGFKVFRIITLPLIKNALVLNLVLSLIEGFKVLGPMQLVTGGGPDNSTLSTVLYIYQLGFERSRMGQASAYAFILFAIILILTLVQLKLSGKEADTHE
ncbi:sugar ABC transporter permease [Mycoplasmatota bacterium]|nr:sugar ABC transporter permease [Mycoplasmatota bacterium]